MQTPRHLAHLSTLILTVVAVLAGLLFGAPTASAQEDPEPQYAVAFYAFDTACEPEDGFVGVYSGWDASGRQVLICQRGGFVPVNNEAQCLFGGTWDDGRGVCLFRKNTPPVCIAPAVPIGEDCWLVLLTDRNLCDVTFADVPAGLYFSEAVEWATCQRITTGTSATTFNPNLAATRAHLAAFLWRYAGEPAGGPHPFVDVPANTYYSEAVAWMFAEGITTGTSATTFSPDDPVTRAQFAAFLWRLDNQPTGFTHPFVDVPPGSYFEAGVAWMAANGITTGTSATMYSPYEALTRGQALTFLFRYNYN